MDHDDLHLSRIDTLWSMVRKAHDTTGDSARKAQELLLDRYGGAIRRYLLASLRNQDAADEVFQEFSLKLVTGAFQKAEASYGRFRSFLKTTLYHLIVDYQRRAKRNVNIPELLDTPDKETPEHATADDEAWTRSWREELLAKSWAALQQSEKTTNTPYYAILRFRLENPELRSPEIASQMSTKLGKPISANSARVMIHRAREMFADRLLDLVVDSLDNDGGRGLALDEAEEELIELNLLEYCRDALAHRRSANA